MKIRRKLTIIVGIVIAAAVCGLVLVHSSAVQRPLIQAILDSIEAETGWRVKIENPRLRLWPARFVAEGVTISTAERVVGSIGHLDTRWSWIGILGSPRRIDDIAIQGLEIDLLDPLVLPESTVAANEAPVDPWRVLEIGRLQLTEGRGVARIFDILGGIDGLRTEVTLVDGTAALTLTADGLQLDRSERSLDLGPVVLRAHGSAEGVVVDELTLGEGDLALSGRGEFKPQDGGSGAGSFTVRADLDRSLAWWDPNLVTGFDPNGVLDLEGHLNYSEDGELEVSAVHRGDRFMIAGYALDELELGLSRGIPTIRAVGTTWGSVAVSVDDSRVATVHALLADAPVDRVLAFVAPRAAALLDGPISLTGEIDGTVSYPITLDTLSGRIDLELVSTRGHIALEARGAGDSWSISEARVDLPGASLTGVGAISAGGGIEAQADLRVDGGKAMERLINDWIPDLELPALDGGPLVAHVNASGSLDRPLYDAEFEWTSPIISNTELDSIRVHAEGDPGSVAFTTALAAAGIEIIADGTAEIDSRRVGGAWNLELDDLHRFAALAGTLPDSSNDLTGHLTGAGNFALAEGRWSVDGSVQGSDVGMGEWRSQELTMVFSLDPEVFEVAKVSVSALGGSIVGSGAAVFEGLDSKISVNAEWRNIDPGSAPADLSKIGRGVASGEMELDGTIAHPTGRVELEWRPEDGASPIPRFRVAGALDGGVLTFITDEVATDAGAVWAQGEVPIGMIPRPPWLWPEATEEALRISARGHGLDSNEIVDLLGLDRPPINATADLEFELSWHPDRPGDTRVFAEFGDLRLHHLGGEVTADGPLTVRGSGDRIEIEPVSLRGRLTIINGKGGVNLLTGEMDGSIEALLAPGFARNIP